MLNLKMETDPTWVKHVVEGNIEEILTDHAYCEQKAASSAISLIVLYPEHEELVEKMADLAQEEMGHFRMVHREIQKRGFKLGRERKDSYVNELMKFTKVKGRGKEETLGDKLLLAAMIEARSCERFKVLSENIDDQDLAKFYHNLMISEARHYTMFIKLARKLCPNIDVDARWQDFLVFEADVIKRYGKSEHVHG
ncbi:tRNA-(ms[2]io[6]A)-hydroxylase [Pontibacter sp. G13]|uniref:tRNA-(ms[2]io[6]A)-hydroxylase n=1 Tax=Pontibacter sp. G13 TaxID=3074898 RepID=UPI00288BA74D|nr:tRNA-(ms[2]io[6]A)-hydroxylase [Pontibacter sp. G13]WNJ15910.1 tRNA-(ms[2]io[6]A)-hydroxylase [Pontibacter sp. G13]